MSPAKKRTEVKLRDIEIEDESETYCPIPFESVPIDTILPMDIFLRIAGTFIKFRAKRDIITNQRRCELVAKYNDAVYVTREDWQHYLAGLELEVKELGPNPRFTSDGVSKIRHLLVAYGKQLEYGREFKKETFDKIRDCTGKVALAIRDNLEFAQTLVRHATDPLLYSTHHAINTTIYSIAVGTKLMLGREELQQLALACFLHDIGKIYVDRKTLIKTGVLSKEEKRQIEQHTTEGALLLASVYPTLPQVQLAAAQHHERVDGSGYPKGLEGKEIHLFAKICKIADVFDFMTSISPAVSIPLDPAAAVEAMRNMRGKFDRQIFGTFESLRKNKFGSNSLLEFVSPVSSEDKKD